MATKKFPSVIYVWQEKDEDAPFLLCDGDIKGAPRDGTLIASYTLSETLHVRDRVEIRKKGMARWFTP